MLLAVGIAFSEHDVEHSSRLLQIDVIKGMQRQIAEDSKMVSSSRSGPINPFEAQRAAGIGDRRYLGKYDARFHSTNRYYPTRPPLNFQIYLAI